MHILTGMLLSLLLGKKSKSKKTHLLSFHGVIETVHILPGRIRVYVPKLVGNDDLKINFIGQISRLDEIHSLEVNTITGSVVIRYDQEKLQPPLLFALLSRLLGLEKEMEKPPQAILNRGLQNGVKAVNHAVYEYSRGYVDLWTLMPLLLTGLGLYRIFKSPQNKFPAGFTILWWAYTALFNVGRR